MNRFPYQLSLLPFRSLGISSALTLCGTLAGFGIITVCSLPARAQERPAADAKAADGSGTSESAAGGALNESEASLERRYQQFERTLLQMAEYLRKTEPERADLLIRAIGRSKENRISQQMEAITQLLKKEQFGDAIGDQQHLVGDLKGLLELLQSEDRRHQLEQEKAYYESLQKEVTKLTAANASCDATEQASGKLEHWASGRAGSARTPNRCSTKSRKRMPAATGRTKAEGQPRSEKREERPR